MKIRTIVTMFLAQFIRRWELRANLNEEEPTEMQVTDPVCGMPIESTKAAATEVVKENTYYFCSPSCHEKFQAAPERYVKEQAGAGKKHGEGCC